MKVYPMQFNIFCYMIIFLSFMGCLSEPGSDEASVSEAETEKEIVQPLTNYYLSGSNHINWIGTKPTGRHNGTIRISQGFISVRNDSILGGRIIIDLNDIQILDLQSDTDNQKKLTNHLKSEDFFDVEHYPLGSFVLTEVNPYQTRETEEKELAIKDANTLVTGNLTLRDSTLSITFPSRIYLSDSLISVDANFNIDRTRWGISYRDETKVENKIKDRFIHNKVNIALDLEIKK